MGDKKYKDEPSEKIEEEVREHPDDEDAQVDLGSDESMDASDPISATQPHEKEELPHRKERKDKG